MVRLTKAVIRSTNLPVTVKTRLGWDENTINIDEVAERLKAPATGLSVGQQQRLCLARALAVEPEILLCDESTASLDPISARGIEKLLQKLKERYTVIMVTHDIDQARRLADYALFMWLGELIEAGPAEQFFAQPKQPLTQAYLNREIG